MKTAIINIKTDLQTKTSAQKVAADLGFSLSAIINGYLNQFIRNRYVHFSLESTMTTELEKLLDTVEKDIIDGKNLSKAMSRAEEIDDYFSSL